MQRANAAVGSTIARSVSGGNATEGTPGVGEAAPAPAPATSAQLSSAQPPQSHLAGLHPLLGNTIPAARRS